MSKKGQLDRDRRDYYRWYNTHHFSPDAIYFEKHGVYTHHPYRSPMWYQFWEERLRRCREGYKVGRWKITGHHYFYLNFTRLRKEIRTGKRVRKVMGFPDFRDYDYDFFWALHIAQHGIRYVDYKKLHLRIKIPKEFLTEDRPAMNMIVAKKRRAGYTLKAAAIVTNIYNTQRKSLSIVGAKDTKYLSKGGIMSKVLDNVNFLNEHTGWKKSRQEIDSADHIMASYIEYINGEPISKGYHSQVLSITFNDNEDAARGKEADFVAFDEAGSFNNLRGAFLATRPSTMSGEDQFGTILIFGTGSKMEGSSIEFEKMFTNPLSYNILPMYNIWDGEKSSHQLVGFFHPVYMNKEGYMDRHGNSRVEKAKESEIEIRQRLAESSDSAAFESYKMEYPMYTFDVFATPETNILALPEVRDRYNIVKREGLYKRVEVCDLILEGNSVKIVESQNTPLLELHSNVKNRAGAVVIYERPIEGLPRNSYMIGYDPYAQDDGTSLAVVTVRKRHKMGVYGGGKIVAKYRGRPGQVNDANRIFMMLCMLYNSEGMHENMFVHVKNYFASQKALSYLEAQPSSVITANIKDSRSARVYGIHMTDKLKDAGESYIKKDLLQIIDYKVVESERIPIRMIDTIDDLALLEDLLAYTRKTNHDDVMSYMMTVFQSEERALRKHGIDNNIAKQIKALI